MDMGNFHDAQPESTIDAVGLLQFMRGRRSVRRYSQKRPVEKAVVRKLIEVALRAYRRERTESDVYRCFQPPGDCQMAPVVCRRIPKEGQRTPK
jgi:hypothetical protein